MISAKTGEQFSKASRPDEMFLDPSIYPISIPVHIRLQDLDILRHVNNVAMAGMFEDVRAQVSDKLNFKRFRGESDRTLIANVQLSYLKEIYRNSALIFHVGIGHIGNSSWRLHTLAVQNEANVFIGNATIVYSGESGAKPLPQSLMRTLETIRLRP